MTLNRLLRLGDPGLYKVSDPVVKDEIPALTDVFEDLHQIILEFRSVYRTGRAVAAPQIGIRKRIICWNVSQAVTMINPELSNLSEKMMEVWDDCMCFPGLKVRVMRHASCTLMFMDENWQLQQWELKGGESELIQHEVDHLNGILATQRAIDNKSFRF